eukprot:sb/3475877/
MCAIVGRPCPLSPVLVLGGIYILGDVLGDLSGDVSGDVLGDVLGDGMYILGDVLGDVIGDVIGDVLGRKGSKGKRREVKGGTGRDGKGRELYAFKHTNILWKYLQMRVTGQQKKWTVPGRMW